MSSSKRITAGLNLVFLLTNWLPNQSKRTQSAQQVKRKQSRTGFKLRSPTPFLTTITMTFCAPPVVSLRINEVTSREHKFYHTTRQSAYFSGSHWIDETLIGATAQVQSGSGININEGVFYTLQISRTVVSPSDAIHYHTRVILFRSGLIPSDKVNTGVLLHT